MNRRDEAMALKAVARARAAAMFREPAGLLRHPYVDPGGPYGDNLWDWDSFWSLRAAAAMTGDPDFAGDAAAWRARVLRHGGGVLDNWIDHQGADGSVPILATPKDVDWFDSRCDPRRNMAKPVLGQLAAALAALDPPAEDLRRWCRGIDRYHRCFEQRYLDPSGLYVWASDVAIGVDDDPTVWGRPPFSSASIFLNALLHADLRAVSAVAGRAGESALAERAAGQAARLAEAVQRHLWDERDGFFYTLDVQSRQRTEPHRYFGTLHANLTPTWPGLLLKVLTWSGFLALWAGLATPAQAERMVREHLMNPVRFWSPHGPRTLSRDERMYDPATHRGNPSNWLGPVWIVSSYTIWEGLRRYGFHDEAGRVAERTIALLARAEREHGAWHENYNPETGEGIAAPGFVSWNLLVHFMLDDALRGAGGGAT
ncbi:MAG TPA: trehalase family glycosidase [Kiritimatiellia bacterium]|nr:trehalase family glycosidase [Kiritimatiellia bacterium]